MRRNAFTWIEFVVVLAIIGVLVAILFPVFQRSQHGGDYDRRSRCQSNLKQLALGVKQYEQDWNNKFPPLAVAQSGYWAGSLQPYLKAWQVFQCPSAKNRATKTTDYFYNARLAQLPEARLKFYSQTVLLGEGRDDSPLNYVLSQLPGRWRDDAKSPAHRHLDGANYVFVDGHAKWLKPDKITDQAPTDQAQDEGTYSLAIR